MSKVAFLATDGVEQIELDKPWQAVGQTEATAVLISPESKIQAYNHLDPSDYYDVDVSLQSANVDDYDVLVLPGGVSNPDALRINDDAVAFVRDFVASGKPVAAICHAPWLLVEAGVSERTLTAFPSLQTDIENSGNRYVDETVVIDKNLITSRKPDDLDAFCQEIQTAIANQSLLV